MKKHKIISLCLMLFVQLVVNPLLAQTVKNISITNPLHQQRSDELIVLQRLDLEKKLGAIPAGKFVAFSTSTSQSITVQYDDVNSDGRWDEAVFLYSFQPQETVVFQLRISNVNASAGAVSKAHVRLKKKNADDSFAPGLVKEEMPLRHPATDFSRQPLPNYLTEGPAWENDKVAFRLYFDVRNNIDIYGKTTSRMVMDSVGQKVHPSYHDLNDWGMDVLHVVKSLGAGALALAVPQANGEDTLIRLGGENVKRTLYEQLADGPVRAVYRMTYDWEVNGKPVKITNVTSIWGGQYFYESRVTVSGAPAGSQLVTGIADFYDNVFQVFEAGTSTILFSQGRQSENKDNLGMAVLVPQSDFSYAASAPQANSEVLTSYLMAQSISGNKPCTYRFYAAWERTDSRFASLKFFKSFLKREAKKSGTPVQIVW